MKLFEIRVEPYPYQTKKHKENPDKYYLVSTFTSTDGSEINVEFLVNIGDEVTISFKRDGSYNLIGKGDQYKILFTVKDIIEKYLFELSEQVSYVSFSADMKEPSRVKLYTKRVVPIINSILGSKWIGPEIKEVFGDQEYMWKNKDAKLPFRFDPDEQDDDYEDPYDDDEEDW